MSHVPNNSAALRVSAMSKLRAYVAHWFWRMVKQSGAFKDRESQWAKRHGKLMTEVTLQQRAHRRKNKKLAGLRAEKTRLRGLQSLNCVHVPFIEELERKHPELAEEIAAHQLARFNALHRKREPN